MTTKSQSNRHTARVVSLTILLSVLAVLGNVMAVPLFYSASFIFGSVFWLVAVVMLGGWPGLIAATAAGLYTWVLWGHPFACAVFVTECLFLIWMTRYKGRSLVMADAMFWLSLGMPMTMTLYVFALDISFLTSFLMAFKQMLNGVFNAVVAGIAILAITLIREKVSAIYLDSAQIKAIIFHTTLLITLVAGGIPILKYGQGQHERTEASIAHALEDYHREIELVLQSGIDATEKNWDDFINRQAFGNELNFAILDAQGTLLVSKGAIVPGLSDDPGAGDVVGDGTLRHIHAVEEQALVKRWQEGRYQLMRTADVNPPKTIVVAQDSDTVSRMMDAATIQLLVWLAVLMAGAVVASRLLSSLLTAPIWRLSAMLSSSTNAIVTTGMDGRVEWVNAGFVRISGYELDEIRGRRPGEFLQGPDTNRETVRRIGEALGENLGFEEEILNYSKQGEPYWIRINCEPLFNAQGKQQGFIAVETDITEQRKLMHLERFGSEALEMISESGGLDETLVAVVRNVESLIPGMRCVIALISPVLEANVDLRPVAYLDVTAGSVRPFTTGHMDSYPISDSKKHDIGIVRLMYGPRVEPSENDALIANRAARIASLAVSDYCTEQKLKESASVFRFANEGIVMTDAANIIVDVNAAFSGITGFKYEDVIGLRIDHLYGPDECPADENESSLKFPSSGEMTKEIRVIGRDNQDIYVRQSISTVHDKNGLVHRYVYIFSDISELRRYQAQLESMAKYDQLTGLPNRALLSDRLSQAMLQSDRTGDELAVFFIDLDGFKSVNDTHGHAFGDDLLKQIADRVQRVMRRGETLARLGGDEFVVVLPQTAAIESCQPVLERILAAVSRKLVLAGREITISASIGVSFYPQSEELDAEQLLRQADQAMYLAKQSGRNQYQVFDAASARAFRDYNGDVKRVQQGLEQDEFALFYQPKVNLQNGDVIGAEALIRWQHAERGLLSPAEFLSLVENHPLAIELGEWVIREALTQVCEWRRLGLLLPVSVNVDPYHLTQPDFVDSIRSIMSEFPDLNPGDFEIEIIETSSVANFEEVSEVIRQCRNFGVSFALDDFGTGYSSFTHLRQLPLDLLKIDMSFVRGMLTDENDMAIVKSVLRLAKSFNLKVIAEGVETVKHSELLTQMGCKYGQGYGISRPMSKERVPGWVETWHGGNGLSSKSGGFSQATEAQ